MYCATLTNDSSTAVVYRIRSQTAGHSNTIMCWRPGWNHICLYVSSSGGRPALLRIASGAECDHIVEQAQLIH